MATQINFYINNSIVNAPKNLKELGVQCDFRDGEFAGQRLTVVDLEFVRENIDIINSWITQGRIFEGLPLKMEEVSTDGQTTNLFDGYIDLVDGPQFQEDRIIVKTKELYSIDWLNDRADSFTFEYLYATQFITDADFINIPYVISSIPDYEKAAISLVTFAFISSTLADIVPNIVGGITAIAVDPFQYGQILIIVTQILQFIVQVTAMLLLLKQMFDMIIQKIKYHKAMTVRKLMEKGSSYLGLGFNSTIIYEDFPDRSLVIIPRKEFIQPNPSNIFYQILGAFQPDQIPQIGYFKGTFGDLIRKLKQVFNAKIIFEGNVMRLERKDYSQYTPTYTIPDVYAPNYTLNTDECFSNYLAEFQVDQTENNTIQSYIGTSFQVQITQATIGNPQLNLLKGLNQIDFDFSLAKRKETLNPIERTFDNILEAVEYIVYPFQIALIVFTNISNQVIDKVNEILDSISTFISIDIPSFPNIPLFVYQQLGSLIDNRIGCLLLEKDSFLNDKLCLVDVESGKITTSNKALISARNIFLRYHVIDTMLSTSNNPNANQFMVKELPTIPFTLADFRQVKNNPVALNVDGVEIKIVSLKYDILNKLGTMKVKIPYIYANNLIANYIEPDGS